MHAGASCGASAAVRGSSWAGQGSASVLNTSCPHRKKQATCSVGGDACAGAVGLYVPGGTAVLPSSTLMLAVPAGIAGCRTIVMATPPRGDGQVCKCGRACSGTAFRLLHETQQCLCWLHA